VDPFAVIILGGTAGLVIALLLLGRFYPGSGADQLDWRPTRTPEQDVQNEIDDLDQMLEAANERRRRRGDPELTEEGLAADVAAELKDSVKRRDDYLADLDIAQMLAAKNERRRAKGLPELSVDEYKAQILGETGEA
jgi:hypothetical protein